MTVGDNWIIKERPFELSREDILWRLGWESVQLWWISGTTHTNFTDARRLFFYGYLWIFLGEHANTNRDCSVHSYNVLLREARIPNPEVIGCRKKKVTSLLKEDAVPGMARLSPSLFSTPLPLSPPPSSSGVSSFDWANFPNTYSNLQAIYFLTYPTKINHTEKTYKICSIL